jgi:hypothetical protein
VEFPEGRIKVIHSPVAYFEVSIFESVSDATIEPSNPHLRHYNMVQDKPEWKGAVGIGFGAETENCCDFMPG